MTSVQRGWTRILATNNSASLNLRRQSADNARQLGHYHPATLRQLRLIWQQSGRPKDWLQYLKFRRALGYPLTAQRARAIEHLLQRPCWLRWKDGVLPAEQRQFARLLQEYQSQPPLHCAWLAAQLQQQAVLLQHWMQRCRAAKHIAIVGNSTNLTGGGAGTQIDQAEIVFRFNHCFSEHTVTADAGQKTDVWVVAPGFRGPQQQAALTILTGPAMLWQLQQLRYLQQLQTPVLHIPLDCWRALVRQFAAPPSAAPLVVQLLLSNGIKPEQLRLFGLSQEPVARYHYALPNHKPSERHHWIAEQHWWQQLSMSGAAC